MPIVVPSVRYEKNLPGRDYSKESKMLRAQERQDGMAAQLSSKSSPVAMSGGPQVHAHGVTCVEPFDFGHVGGYLSIQIGEKVDVLSLIHI